MQIKNLFLIGLIAGQAAAHVEEEALDLELEVGGKRELFALTPGTKCPAGHKCRARNSRAGVDTMMSALNDEGLSPMMASLKHNLESPVTAPETWRQLNQDLTTVVESDDYCQRRGAMARAAGLAAGLSAMAVGAPAFAAGKTVVKMGADSGQLVYVPDKIKICKGDTVEWVINKAGPHNVVFDEEAVPSGVKVEDISMDEQLGEEGDTFSKSFDVAGVYGYYCEPHRSAGMQGQVTVA